MIDIGFMVPTCRYYFDPFRNQPLVQLYLLSIIEDRLGDRFSTSLIDLRGVDPEKLEFHVPEKNVFLHSVGTQDFFETSNLVRNLRAIYPQAVHVAGGPHVNLFPDECAGVFDALVFGEGEESMMQLLNDYAAAAMKPIYHPGKPVNLDDYPFASRKFLPKKTVVNTGIMPGEFASLPATAFIFSRGCPFDCYFCANNDLTLGPVRARSPELVVAEIEYLKREYGVQAIAFKDDNAVPVNNRTALAHLEAIGGCHVKWKGQSRANGISEEVVKLAKEAGAVEIALGIESASQDVLNIINKRCDLVQARDYIRTLRLHGIGVRLNLIIGLPNEPDDIVARTLAFIDEAKPTSVLLSYLNPVPGSEIFNHPERFGITINSYDWERYGCAAGRFSEDELPDILFDYNDVTPWGKGMTRETINHNYTELQGILRDRGLNS